MRKRSRKKPSTARKEVACLHHRLDEYMILHGIEAPNIVHTNTLAENLADIREKDRYDIILANPHLAAKERAECNRASDKRAAEPLSVPSAFHQKVLQAGGRAGVVIKEYLSFQY